jgi:RNA-directed DNA polymerase
VSQGLVGVRKAARENKEMRFTSLLHHVSVDLLRASFHSLKRKAAPGVDGVTWQEYESGLEGRLTDLHSRVHRGAYRAQPSRRVYIEKEDGRKRPLGVAALEDKIVQQAVVAVLNQIYEEDFLGFSYGFRPGRSQHQALDALTYALMKKKVNYVLDADIQGFFDNLDKSWLIKFVEHRVADPRILRLIRKWLNAGVMEEGQWSDTRTGTPQGSVLSPLLSNLVLDELDHELERRGHRYVRYADDCNIYVRSERAGHRVMTSITRFITQRLKLKVNEAKSAVARPQERKFLRFSFTSDPEIRRAIAPKALSRFKDKIREITRQAKGISIETTVKRLATYMVGWRGYFGFCETPEVLIGLIRWVRLRLRCALWRQWKTPRRRRAALLQLGVRPRLAANTAGSGRGPWYLARSKALSVGASNAYFRSLGLPSLFENY